MLRQPAGALANKLFCGLQGATAQQNGSKLMFNALLSSSSRAAAEGVEGQAVASAMPKEAAQYSSAAAAALAAKRQGLIGSGMSVMRSSQPFAARGLATSTASTAPAVAAVAAEQEKSKWTLAKKIATAVAAVAAAIGLTSTTAMADVPGPWQILFQDMATSNGQATIDLHHDITFFLITVCCLVFYMMYQIITKFHYSKVLMPEKLTHHTTIEVIWTIIPTFIVLMIAIPSLTLIYSLDQHTERPGLTVKIVGRQWYWSYEMHDHLQHKLVDPDRMVGIAEKALTA